MIRRKTKYQHAKKPKKGYKHAKKSKIGYYFVTSIIVLFLLGALGWVLGYNSGDNKIDTNNSVASKELENQEVKKETEEKSKEEENNSQENNSQENNTLNKDENEIVEDINTNQSEELEIVNEVSVVENNEGYSIEDLEEDTVTYHTHEHVWVDIIEDITYPEEGHMEKVLVKEAVYEEVPIYEKKIILICSGCGEDISGNPWKHREEQLAIGNNGCIAHYEDEVEVQVGTEKKLVSEEVYEEQWVVDKEEETIEEVVGHKCEICGEIDH